MTNGQGRCELVESPWFMRMRFSSLQWRRILGFVFLTIAPWASRAQTVPGEEAAFNAAVRAFQDRVYDRSARELDAFVKQHPQSERAAEALLMRARALLELQQAPVAASILADYMAKAGPLADQYQYVLGEAFLRQTNYEKAASAFGSLVQDLPKSPLVLDACFQEAWARFRLGDLQGVVTLLQTPASPFQTLAREAPEAPAAAEGYLLLSLALLQQQQFAAAEQALAALAPLPLAPPLKWRRQYLLCQIQMEDQRLGAALTGTTNLLELAAAAAQPSLVATSMAMQGTILTRLGRFSDASRAYERNLADTVPGEQRMQALLSIIALGLDHRPKEELIPLLESFISAYPKGRATEEALVTLGELRLRQSLEWAQEGRGTQAGQTNPVQRAMERFDQVLAEHGNNLLEGRAQLGRGWCFWALNRNAEALAAFQAAAEALPPSEEQAVARFKVADTQLKQGDPTNAVANLKRLLDDYKEKAAVRDRLFPHAYYQLLRGSLELGELAAATVAMQAILRDYPQSAFRDPGMLLVGQAVSENGDRGLARSIFQEFMKRFSDSPLLAEVGLALARSYVEDQEWKSAIEHYTSWISQFPTNGLRARAEFNLAWANAQAGFETNALTLFTNFVERFPTNELAARARYWVGDYFFSQKRYVEAQIQYQKLAETFAGQPISYQARMMAGRAAFASRFWNDAAGPRDPGGNLQPRGHFTALAMDETCPPDLRAQAYFALGDTLIEQGQTTSANARRQRFEDAVVAFRKIRDFYPTNRLALLAWGREGDCYLQLGTVDSSFYRQATNAYWKVLQSSLAPVPARCQAEVGIGRCLEQLAETLPAAQRAPLLTTARDHYLNVVYGNAAEGRPPEPFWIKEAGLAAARLAESMENWEIASNLYSRLADLLPPMRSSMERRLQRVQERLRQTPE